MRVVVRKQRPSHAVPKARPSHAVPTATAQIASKWSLQARRAVASLSQALIWRALQPKGTVLETAQCKGLAVLGRREQYERPAAPAVPSFFSRGLRAPRGQRRRHSINRQARAPRCAEVQAFGRWERRALRAGNRAAGGSPARPCAHQRHCRDTLFRIILNQRLEGRVFPCVTWTA